MSSLSKVKNLTLAAFYAGLVINPGAVLAQGGSPLPPPPLPSASNASAGNSSAALVPIGGVSGGGPARSMPAPVSAMPAPGSAMPAPGSAMPGPESEPPAVTVNTADLVVVPGPGEDKRRALLGRIMEAKSRGIGTSTYMMAFDALEQSVKSGAVDEAVFKRCDSLNSSLDDQFKRKAILKTQRAAPPVAASDPSQPLGSGSIFGSGGPGIGGAGTSDTAALIQKLQSKYGNQIPDNLKDKIPAGMGGGNPADLLKNPQVQDLLKSMKNK